MTKKIFTISVIALLLDQISKYVIATYCKLNESLTLIKNILYITYCQNKGVAWSMLTNQRVLIIIISIIAIIVISRFINTFKKNTRNQIAFGLILGGLFGNLLDRIIFGYVRDFIDIIIINYDYPIFNVADIAIVIGVILLMIAIIKGEDVTNENSSTNRR